jgi:WD40 repeat protein
MTSPVIPDHTLLSSIGHGAYGEVWLARNVMGTLRAVKVIWRRQFESARPFEREFAGIQRYEPVSRISGGLVHVLHVGRNDAEGYFYYVMELADNAAQGPKPESPNPKEGQNRKADSGGREPGLADGSPILDAYQPRTLRADLKRHVRLSTAECLRLAIDVASGLQQLHRHGLVHRDVKPGNIIYVNGRAKLADIGLVTGEGEGRTFVGTEGYVPPEGPGAPAADLYGLGVVLYEASTGLSPEKLPDVPQEWFTAPEGDQALEFHQIILKACEGQRERRYQNADAMQADLALLQSGESLRHTRALHRRYARLRMTGMVGTALLVLTLGAALFANYRARLETANREKEALLRQRAQEEQGHAETAEREARRQLQAALYEEARALVLSRELGHRTRALEAIRQATGSTNLAEFRRVAFAALGLPDLRLESALPLRVDFTFLLLDPTFQRMALGDGNRPVTIRSIPGLQVLASLPPTSDRDAYGSLWSPDGRFLAVPRRYDEINSRADLEVWNVAQTQLLFTASEDIPYGAFSFHPHRPLLMAGHVGGAVSVWDLETLTESRPFQFPGTPHTLAYSLDGQRIAASYQRGSNWVVAFHDATSGALLGATECPEPVHVIKWHPRAQWVGVTSAQVNEWNRGVWLLPVDGGPATLLGQHRIKQTYLSFNPDGRFLMSCGWDRETLCWDLQTRQRVFTFPASGYYLDWNEDGSRCATVPKGTTRLHLYAFERPLCLELTGNRGGTLGPGTFSPDGRFLAITEGQNICLWDLARSSQPAFVFAGGDPFLSFFSPDSSQLFAVAGRMGQVRFSAWRLESGTNAIGPPQLTALPVALPPSLNWAGLAGDQLVLTSEEGVRFVSLTNLASTDDRVVKIPPGMGTVSPDGRWLAVIYSYSPLITVYRLPQVLQVARFTTTNLVARVRFSPRSDELLVINRGGIEQWDTKRWQLRRHEPGSPVADGYVLYSPDQDALWRVTNYHDTALCARRDLEPILPLPANLAPLAVSNDGRRLAVSADDQRVQVWDLVELRKQFRDLGLDWVNP